MDGLRRAGDTTGLPLGLLTRAWLRSLEGTRTGPESAQGDLDEAWEIAERGPMKLFMADIHLHRARLFFREAEYPWHSPPPISPPRASALSNAATGGAKRSWRMPSGLLAGAESDPLLSLPLRKGEVGRASPLRRGRLVGVRLGPRSESRARMKGTTRLPLEAVANPRSMGK